MTFIKHYILALLVFNLVGCSTLQPVSVENAMRNSPPPGVDYGSLVQVTTLDKQTAKFRVTAINDDGLGSSKQFYRYENMASLKVESQNSNNNNVWPVVLGILGVAGLVFLVANADAVRVCSPSPC